jgi:twinkle protein
LKFGEFRGLTKRRISEETCKHFGYYITEENQHVAPYYDEDRNLVAQKIREKGKGFFALGEIKTALPFGSHAFPKTGRKLVVTEGEIDAMSMSQVQGNKYPVVSIGCGAGPQVKKYIARHLSYFEGFEEVVLMFDSDEPGLQAAQDAAEVLGPRAKIAELPLKDANDMLRAGRTKELIDAMWRAKPYRPEGIVSMDDLLEDALKEPEVGISWPFPTLTDHTFGMRLGEIYALGAGTGVGKTDFFTQCVSHFIAEHPDEKMGYFALEQQPRETALRVAGKLLHRPLHIPGVERTEDEVRDAFAQSEGKVFLYDSFGANEWEIIRSKIEYLVHACDVRWFFLDHLTALAAMEDDERKRLDKIMADMGALVKKLNCTIILISHLATPQGVPHEEGGRVTIRHFRGSRAIGFWCHYIFALERNQQAEDPEERKLTTFRILKDRYTGRATGEKFYITYNYDSGLLHEVAAESFGFDDDGADNADI